MPGKIFISYRRDDDPAFAARVRDGLAAKFGQAALFMDVDNLLAGQRFDDELAKALKECDVLVAIMGTRWMTVLAAKTAAGERDYVREEISAALQRRIVVIPARVGREGLLVPLPRAADLPEDIRELVQHQKHDVTHEHFGRDVGGLAAAIAAVRQSKRPPRPWGKVAAAAVVALLLGGGVMANQMGLLPWPQDETARQRAAQVAAAATAETKRLADLDNRLKQESEARQKAEAHNKQLLEAAARAKRDQDERQKAEAEAAAKARAEETERQRLVAEAKRKADEDAAKRVAQPGQVFRDCNDLCPEMVVVPPGRFTMGEGSNTKDVTIPQAFAVGKFSVTFDEWDACVAAGGCGGYRPEDRGWGRGRRPVINVNWDDAKRYVDWLSKKTGKPYRLLSEAEREYATRAGTTTTYSWGPDPGKGNANCDGCGSQWDNKQTAPVGSFKPNPFGLHDTHGNVWERTEDCWNDSNSGNPGNGSARTSGDCSLRVVRGGSWNGLPGDLRAASRSRVTSGNRLSDLGFRVGRTLTP